MVTTFLSPTDLASMRAYYEQSMTSSIQVEHASDAADRNGKLTYSEPVTVKAHLLQETAEFYNSGGQLIVSTTTVKVPFGTGLEATDRITLPDGMVPVILSVDDGVPSDDWPLYERLRTGRA